MSTNKDTFPPSRTRYGTANPEKAESAVWTRAIREGWGGYALRQHYESKGGADGSSCGNYSLSTYRDSIPGPYWSWDRFGRTSTTLPDGRIIHVAGEHEDHYDYDFCIYNDVIVEHPDGRLEFHLYPRDVFPPTDFHTATLIGDDIILIGSLGYRDMRRIGETQMLRLNTRTLRIEPIETSGDGPGWISRHRVERLDETRLLIVGGSIQTEESYAPNKALFELDLSTMSWRRVAYGDRSIFPITEDAYRKYKSPRFGNANPERSDNPFWHEMLRRNWTARRARQHFGDFAQPEDAPPAAIEDNSYRQQTDTAQVVWTAVREHAAVVTLADGREFRIGGEVRDHHDDSIDGWTYNDVIVANPDGAFEIFTYPLEAFPDLRALSAIPANDAIYLFGVANRARDEKLPHGPHVFRLDTASYAITQLPSAPSHLRVSPFNAVHSIEDNCAVLPIVRQTRNDPVLYVKFDLENHRWGAPYPAPKPSGNRG
jgi:hypothetical protein